MNLYTQQSHQMWCSGRYVTFCVQSLRPSGAGMASGVGISTSSGFPPASPHQGMGIRSVCLSSDSLRGVMWTISCISYFLCQVSTSAYQQLERFLPSQKRNTKPWMLFLVLLVHTGRYFHVRSWGLRPPRAAPITGGASLKQGATTQLWESPAAP